MPTRRPYRKTRYNLAPLPPILLAALEDGCLAPFPEWEARAIQVCISRMPTHFKKEPKIEGPKDVVNAFWYLTSHPTESLYTVYLNAQNYVKGILRLSSGDQTSAPVPITLLVQGALGVNATSVVLVHNHPSGNPTFSPEDRGIIQKVESALGLFRIRLHDFITIGEQGWVSAKDQGDM